VWKGSGSIAARSSLPGKAGLTGKDSDLYFGGAGFESQSGRVVSRDFLESLQANDEAVSTFSRRSNIPIHFASLVNSACTGIYSVRSCHRKQSNCCGFQKNRTQSSVPKKINLP
jgi:hypothetical protein